MNYKLANYSKETPRKWQLTGDLAILLIPVLITIVESSPFTESTQETLMFWMSSLLAIVKVLTQFFGPEK